ncbi:MAG: arginine deiminase [Saprospiraceae bacterium]|nr:arginine deiminase [Saprospiraceae bacterium]
MPLKKVIVHAPDEGIDRISPRLANELLFDDIVYLPSMQKEHAVFRMILNAFVGEENVLETQTLIKESFDASEEIKKELIHLVKDFEEIPKSYVDRLYALSHDRLAEVMISGYDREKDTYLFDPIPNFIFTRDIALTIKDHVVITKASKAVRKRENLLTRFFFHAHPQFSHLITEKRLINLNQIDDYPPSQKGEPVTIEGGDLMLLNSDYLLIGNSERTTDHALMTLRNILFEKKLIRNVVEVDVPKERSFMHIDTLFTQINHNQFVGYKPIIKDGLGSYVTVYRDTGGVVEYPSVYDFLRSEISSNAQFIWSGDGVSPYQEREQWTDGCNLVALKPGVALTYDRNPYTEKAFINNGFQIIHAETLIERMKNENFDVHSLSNTIITLPSSELSRARGGSHCMSCPVLRDKLAYA